MAKKSKDEVPNPNSVSNRDILQRLNFLYQASVLLGTAHVPPKPFREPIPETLKGKERKLEMRRRNNVQPNAEPRGYVLAHDHHVLQSQTFG